MLSPLVSVVVSAYNRPSLFRQGLGSVLEQIHRNLEILVQDDSTDDRCGQIVRQFSDPRVSYKRNIPSLGTLENLRAGYRRCTGKYVCTLNDDDMYSPTYLEVMVSALEDNPSCCLAFADHFICDDLGEVDKAETEQNSRRFGRDQLETGVMTSPLRAALITKSVPGMFAVYRRELMDFNNFPDEVSSGYDYWMVYLAARSGRPMYYSSDRLTSYRVHNSSQTSSFADPQHRLRSLAYDHFTIESLSADSRLREIHGELIDRLAGIHTSFGSTWVRLGKRRNAVREFWRALRVRPSFAAMAGLLVAVVPFSLSTRVFAMRKAAAENVR